MEGIHLNTKINEAIKHVLQQFGDKYFIGDIVNKNKVIQDLDGYDAPLLEAFVTNETIKNNFTIDIAGNIVMQTNKLIELFEADEYWQDSYTKYSKKIGLTAGGKFIDESTDVVLDFPYKDTVLKASMSKEDTDKDDLRPDEPFLNEVIAKEEIDVLLDKKILVNAKKYDENGVHDIASFDENDNLIIKGNNLLALHTLKEKYAGKVKMIYIDPPYYFMNDRAEDSFKYNTNFKLSTWLTFMKNRLDIAEKLLTENGAIFVQANDDGLAETDMLLQNIFGKENKIANIAWRRTDNQSNIGNIAKVKDYIIIYAKKVEKFKLNRLPLSDKAKKEYRYEDENGKFRRAILLHKTRGRYHFDLTTPTGNVLKGPWMKKKEDILEMDRKGEIYWTKGGQEQPYGKIYLHESEGQIANDFWDIEFGTNQRGANEITSLFGERLFDFPKPEKLMENLIRIGTNEGEIILDYHMGSATTQAVAHKMNRCYIGIEQMDYINTVSVPRLQKVIEGEQGGISKDVEWQGGGSFVYLELMEKNRGFLISIQHAKTQTELHEVLEFMLKEAEIDFRVDLEAVKDTLHELSLDDQKRTLLKIIDKNQLYYNYSEIDDENVRDLINDSDYSFNKNFYEGGE